MKNNIILIGYRGTGKTTLGRALSKKLKFNFKDLDDEIVKYTNMPIPEIVEKFGWPEFRDIEHKVLTDNINKENTVISCGGGIIELETNRSMLKNQKCVVWLKANIDTITDRIKDDSNRPALTDNNDFISEIKQVLDRRIPLYQECCQIEIDTDDKSIENLKDEILSCTKNIT